MCVVTTFLPAGFAMLETGSCRAKGASDDALNRSPVGSQLPSSLRSSTLGYAFDLSLDRSQLLSSLHSLMSGGELNQSREGTQLSSSLRSLTFGYAFNRSLEGSQLPNLQSLMSGGEFNVWLEGTLTQLSIAACGV